MAICWLGFNSLNEIFKATEEEEADQTIAGYTKRTRGSYSFGKVLCDSLKPKVQCSKITQKSNRPLDSITFIRWVVPQRFLKATVMGGQVVCLFCCQHVAEC